MKPLDKMNKRREADLGEGGIPQFGTAFKKHCHRDHESMSKALKRAIEILKLRHEWVKSNFPKPIYGEGSNEGIYLKEIESILEGKG